MTRERRIQARETLSDLAFIQINRDEGGRILNISESGLCFETFASIERERLLRFWFSLDLRDRIEATGRLAWLDGDRKIGGLRFLELSAKAQKHLRAHLKIMPRREEPPAYGSAFLAVLKHASAEFAAQAKPAERPKAVDRAEPVQRAAFREESGERTEAAASVLELPVKSPAAKRISVIPFGMVPLERYRTTKRRQFVNGVLLGVAATVALAVFAGKYLGRSRMGSEAGSLTTVPARATAGPPVTPVSAGTATGAGAAASAKPVWDPQPTSRGDSRGDPRAGAAFVASRTPSRAARDPQSANVASSESEAKLNKRSSATPQQLWAALQRGSTTAAVTLADRYLQGDGVPVNCDQARVLLLFASEKNNAEAIRKMRELTKTGCPKAPGATAPPTQPSSPTKDPGKP